MRPLTAEWIAKAEEDYAAAQHLSRKRKSALPSIVCFHCQQCAEKYLKARLVEAGKHYPKTHDLEEVLDLILPIEPHLEVLRGKLASLTDYAFEFRYPGESATKEVARIALTNCRSVREELRLSLGLDKPPSTQMNLGIKERRGQYKARRKKA
jgi:HEPN domain-containing protein